MSETRGWAIKMPAFNKEGWIFKPWWNRTRAGVWRETFPYEEDRKDAKKAGYRAVKVRIIEEGDDV